MDRIKEYYVLTKPGIIKGNLIVAIAAYFFGADNHINAATLTGLALGTSSMIAAGCIVNNYFDRHIDKHMKRTQTRALVTGAIRPTHALGLALLFGIIGVSSLGLLVNSTTLLVGIIGFLSYAFVYTFAKHKTIYATLIGTLPGATPPVAGYAAATNAIDGASAILFASLFAWQMAHFYAISLFRLQEYRAAQIPVFASRRGTRKTQRHITAYILLFTCVTPLLSVAGYASHTFGIVMATLGMYWLYMSLQSRNSTEIWAQRVFRFSLLLLLLVSALLVSNAYLP